MRQNMCLNIENNTLKSEHTYKRGSNLEMLQQQFHETSTQIVKF